MLLSQVENTVPFALADSFDEDPAQPHVAFLRAVFRKDRTIEGPVDYFRLCLSAHYATVASFVPTDVDNAIRFKLWSPGLSEETLEAMARLVEESYAWSGRGLSARLVEHGVGGPPLSGLTGEWYGTAAAAYGALRRRFPGRAASLHDRICAEVEREERIFERFVEQRDGRRMLEAATVLAHNLGDLDRVIEQWNLPEGDPLRSAVFRKGHDGETASARAGALNKAMTAVENHRHLCLRGPRCLRRRSEWLLPIGPFFDDWGRTIGRGLSPEEAGEVAEALVDGAVRLPETIGYARALAGIVDSLPGGGGALRRNVPARVFRLIESGRLRSALSIPQARFEASWKQAAEKRLNNHNKSN